MDQTLHALAAANPETMLWQRDLLIAQGGRVLCHSTDREEWICY